MSVLAMVFEVFFSPLPLLTCGYCSAVCGEMIDMAIGY